MTTQSVRVNVGGMLHLHHDQGIVSVGLNSETGISPMSERGEHADMADTGMHTA